MIIILPGKVFMDLKEKTISSEQIYKGKIIDVYKDRVICPNGKESVREVVRHCKASCVVAELDGKIIMERQYRYPFDEVMIELPAGKFDPKETPEECARRELEEETGYHANEIIYLGKVCPTIAYDDEIIYLLLAKDLVKTHTNLDPNEFVEVYTDTLENVLEQIRKGEIVDSKTIAGIMQYMLYKEKNKQ